MTFYSKDELYKIATETLNKAKELGASSAEIYVSTGVGFEVQVRNVALENIQHHKERELGLTVYFGKRRGVAITSDFNQHALEMTIQKACHIAKHTNEDLFSGLADKELMASNYPDLDLYYPWNINVDQAIAMAIACEKSGFAEDKRIINSEGTNVHTFSSFMVYANTHGFIGSYPVSLHGISCALIAKQNDVMQVDYEYTVARDSAELIDPLLIGKQAAIKTVKKLNAKHLTTRECPVIFLAPVAKSLIGNFLSAINGGNLYNKASFLLDSLNQQVFAKHINIEEQPLLQKGYGSAPFDGEGVITKPRSIVRDGILRGYVLNSYAARKLNMQTTGNAGGVRNVFVTSGKNNLDELLKLMGTGLLITELFGQGVNIITGDYSRGCFGFWVENGELQYPVEGITVAGNLKNLFLDVIAIGNDIDNRGNIRSGSIFIEKMKIAGNS